MILPDGYASKTVTYKKVGRLEILLDVWYPEATLNLTVALIHYHGGFLIMGDRHTLLPYWLINAAASRKWIFVSPDYRLMPESSAEDAVQDAIDAYQWVAKSLVGEIGIKASSIVVAGSSAGAYLALVSSTLVSPKPSHLVLLYGLLNPSDRRYQIKGTNIFWQPPIDSGPVLEEIARLRGKGQQAVISSYPWPENPTKDPRSKIIAAFHCDALFPDYMTGIPGLSEQIRQHGLQAIPENKRKLYPVAFDLCSGLPAAIIVHGRNDAAVPVSQSEVAAEKLREFGVQVDTYFPEDAQHGFDAHLGNINLEARSSAQLTTPAIESLRAVIEILAESTRP